MKRVFINLALVLSLTAPGALPAVEEAEYTVISRDGDVEVRQYATSIVAETPM